MHVHGIVHINHLNFLGYLRGKTRWTQMKRGKATCPIVMNDFPESLWLSGAWDVCPDVQNGVDTEADVYKHVQPTSNCLESRKFAQHKESWLINAIKK